MPSDSRNSIRRTLSTRIGFIILSIGLMVGALFFLFSIRLSNVEFQNRINTQTKHLSDTFTQQLWLFDHNGARQLARLAVDSPGITGLRLLDHQRKIVVEDVEPVKNPSPVTVHKDLLYENKTPVGYIEISFVNQSQKKQRHLIVIAGICMMLLTIFASLFLISYLLNRHLTRPLKNLGEDMMALTKGKFQTSGIQGQKKEIQDIINVFNLMADTLAEREISQKKAENRLTREKIFVEALINTLPGLFYVYEEGERLVRWNNNFLALSGMTPEEIRHKPPGFWVRKEDRDAVDESVQKALTHGNASYEMDLMFQANPVPHFLTATSFSDRGKKYLVGVAIDLTRRKELEKALRQAHKMESIGTLAGGIAHDFNNILFPLLGYAEMLREDLPENGAMKKRADEIYKAALRARELVRQILTISRKGDQELAPIKIQSVLTETVKLLEATIPKTIDIQTQIDLDCGRVIADSTQIHQVIINLATNAYHAMQEKGGCLKIILSQTEIDRTSAKVKQLRHGRYVLLRVVDTGLGIPRQTLDKIFDPYFTTKETGKGTGLGLAIVQGIVKTFNGEIEVDSELGKGTEVRIYLPVTSEEKRSTPMDPVNKIQSGTEHILLVDDEASVLTMMKTILVRQGYTVTATGGAAEALDIFVRQPDGFNLVISDMTMPGFTGLDLARKIKRVRPEVPVLICTGYSEGISAETFREDGVQGFLSKPVQARDMSRAIRAILDPGS